MQTRGVRRALRGGGLGLDERKSRELGESGQLEEGDEATSW